MPASPRARVAVIFKGSSHFCIIDIVNNFRAVYELTMQSWPLGLISEILSFSIGKEKDLTSEKVSAALVQG